jgi:ABC-type Mn2+/Zn2+ transport system permease subunit
MLNTRYFAIASTGALLRAALLVAVTPVVINYRLTSALTQVLTVAEDVAATSNGAVNPQ